MVFPFYTGAADKRGPDNPVALPRSRRAEQTAAEGYLPDPGLVDAVNVCLLLGQPLLLTGEPGTGKTQLAYSVGWELGFGVPLMFETKSNSTARDLFYTYDTLGRFHAAQTKEGSQDSLDYLTYNALGIAILRANQESVVAPWLPRGFLHGGPQRSVVLIDEVDKAPRDFPNDILNEVENMYFKIVELGNVTITADEAMRPILILTSNSEKHLPDAFLRRCVYYNIPFPDRARLDQIVTARLGHFKNHGDQWLSDALDLFLKLREPNSGLNKKPATAELLGWLMFLKERSGNTHDSLRQQGSLLLSSLGALVKSAEDQQAARIIVEEWLK